MSYQVNIAGKLVATIHLIDGEWCLQQHRESGTLGRIDRFEKLSEAKDEAMKLGKVKFVRML